MNIENLRQVCVVGAGVMGRQIALVAALHGYEVRLNDAAAPALDDAAAWCETYLEERVAKGRLDRDAANAALARLHPEGDLAAACGGSQLVIEAIVEDVQKKREIFGKLSALTGGDTVLATNSSYMVSSLFADRVKHPARLANLHFFVPALVMQLVEVVKGAHTGGDTVEFLMEYCRRVGKTPVLVAKEYDGFIVNSILRALKDQAYTLLEQGVATCEDIDTAVELGLKHPMGPFRLTDLTGIDNNLFAYERRLAQTGIKPPGYDIVKAKVEAGQLGRKTKKGYYSYE